MILVLVEQATEYFLGKFLDDLIKVVYGEEDIDDELKAFTIAILSNENRLKTISTTTAYYWLAYLEYIYGLNKKIYYTDYNERKDIREHKKWYVKKETQEEIGKYCWMRLNGAQKGHLKLVEKDPPDKDSFERTYDETNGVLYEYNFS